MRGLLEGAPPLSTPFEDFIRTVAGLDTRRDTAAKGGTPRADDAFDTLDNLIHYARGILRGSVPEGDTWYESRDNLRILAEFLENQDTGRYASTIVHMLEDPWSYEVEFKLAKAVSDHEAATDHKCQQGPWDRIDSFPDDLDVEERWWCDPGDGTTCDWHYPPLTTDERVADLERIIEGLAH